MTEAERDRELHIAYETALGRSCECRKPTPLEEAAALVEAQEWVRRCDEAERKQFSDR